MVRLSGSSAGLVPKIIAFIITRPGFVVQGRKNELEGRSVIEIRCGPEPSPVRLDDRPADREAHAHACLLRREKGVEHPVCIARSQSNAGILYGDEDFIRASPAGPKLQDSRPLEDATHGFDGVQHEIQYDLLQLDSVSCDQRNVGVASQIE